MAKKKYIGDNPQLMAEWDWEENNAQGHNPKELLCSSHTQVSWCCPKCKLSYPARISDRVYKNSGCSYCAGKRPIPGVNDLETWCKANGRTDLLDDWNPALNSGKLPSDFTYASNRKVVWECSICGDIYPKQIDQRTLRNFGCQECRIIGTSFPEQFLYICLDTIVGSTKNGYRDFGFEIDIYLESLKVAIEYNGEYYHKKLDRHYEDDKKEEKCLALGIGFFRIEENRDSEFPIRLVDNTINWHYSRKKDDVLQLLCALLDAINEKTEKDFGINKLDVNSAYQKALKRTFGVKPEKSLAYRFPQIAAEWDYEVNGDILPINVSYGSHDPFGWVCSNCGNKWTVSVNQRTCGHGCNECAIRERAKMMREKAVAQNNLKSWCVENNPLLLEEWDYSKNEKGPEEYSVGSNDHVNWVCRTCGNNWETPVYRRTLSGSGCGQCWNARRKNIYRNDKTVEDSNSLVNWCHRNNRMDLLEEWDYDINEFPPQNYTYGSTREVHWKCINGHKWPAKIKTRTTQGNGCKQCRYKK